MNKLLLFFLSLFILALVLVYIFIPGKIRISTISLIRCTPKALAPFLNNDKGWKYWWPQPDSTDNTVSSASYKNYSYKLITPFTDGAEVEVSTKKDHFNTRIILIPLGIDSVRVEWQAVLVSGINPISRIVQYSKAVHLKNNTNDLLENLHEFADKTENIYGFHIERTTFTDTILVATKFFTDSLPTNEIIYRAVKQLKEKIKDEGASEKDFPMLNIREKDGNHYEAMIAICVDKEIEKEGNIFFSRMVPMKDRFLETEVTGGPLTIKNAHQAIENYMNDHFLSAPAIPFEILVTDRSKETDTSKWRTKIFYPSM
jgi:hypothetical protein